MNKKISFLLGNWWCYQYLSYLGLWFLCMEDLRIVVRIRWRLVLHYAVLFFLVCKGWVNATGHMWTSVLPVVLSLGHVLCVLAVGQVFSITCSRGSVLNFFWDLYRHIVLCLSPYLPTCIFFSRKHWCMEISVQHGLFLLRSQDTAMMQSAVRHEWTMASPPFTACSAKKSWTEGYFWIKLSTFNTCALLPLDFTLLWILGSVQLASVSLLVM